MAESDSGYFLRSQRTPMYNALETSATFIDEIQNQKTPMCDDRQLDDPDYIRHSPSELLIPGLATSPVRLEDEQRHDISELHSPLHESETDVRSEQDLQRVPVTQSPHSVFISRRNDRSYNLAPLNTRTRESSLPPEIENARKPTYPTNIQRKSFYKPEQGHVQQSPNTDNQELASTVASLQTQVTQMTTGMKEMSNGMADTRRSLEAMMCNTLQNMNTMMSKNMADIQQSRDNTVQTQSAHRNSQEPILETIRKHSVNHTAPTQTTSSTRKHAQNPNRYQYSQLHTNVEGGPEFHYEERNSLFDLGQPPPPDHIQQTLVKRRYQSGVGPVHINPHNQHNRQERNSQNNQPACQYQTNQPDTPFTLQTNRHGEDRPTISHPQQSQSSIPHSNRQRSSRSQVTRHSRQPRRGDDSDDDSDDLPRRSTHRNGDSHHKRRPTKRYESLSSEESEHGSSQLLSYSSQRSKRNTSSHHTRLPAFTAQEPWTVYYNRFKSVAKLEGWTDREKLRELLPRLQGKAGEFVYDQLRSDVREDFRSLVHELKHRFRKVETARTYGAQFSHRNQQSGETIEDFAADLKRLYDKAYANRDRDTRREDLLRRFLDGIQDDATRFQVEYNKEPHDIDEAVFDVINCQETKKRTFTEDKTRKPVRSIDDQDIDQLNEDFECEEEELRMVAHKNRAGIHYRPQFQRKPILQQQQTPHQNQKLESSESRNSDNLDVLMKILIEKLSNSTPAQTTTKSDTLEPVLCYRCAQPGHFARECRQNEKSNQYPMQTTNKPVTGNQQKFTVPSYSRTTDMSTHNSLHTRFPSNYQGSV